MKKLVFSSIVGIGILFTSGLNWRQLQSAKADVTIRRSAPTFTLDPSELDLSTSAFVPDNLPISNEPDGGRGIIGPDDRTEVRLRAYPWTAIGRLDGMTQDGGRYHCTATLIDVDIILTNSHCVIDPETSQFAARLVFSPNVIDGTVSSPLDRTEVIDGLLGTEFQDRSDPPHEDDWAILKLNKSLGEQFGTIPLKAIDTQTLVQGTYRNNLIMVGYSGDYPAVLPGLTAAAHIGCSITAEAEEVIYHICDTYGGSSGGPLLAKDGEDYSIVGLNAAAQLDREERGVVNYGVKISRILDRFPQLTSR
ncbi:trypsin-like peptidase domain-containing protein [Leptothoe sp. EHU-05/26/07-4]